MSSEHNLYDFLQKVKLLECFKKDDKQQMLSGNWKSPLNFVSYLRVEFHRTWICSWLYRKGHPPIAEGVWIVLSAMRDRRTKNCQMPNEDCTYTDSRHLPKTAARRLNQEGPYTASEGRSVLCVPLSRIYSSAHFH